MKSSSTRITDFTRGDAPELVDMWRESFEFGVGVNVPYSVEEQFLYLSERILPRNSVQIAWRDNVIAGFVASNGRSISQLYVRVACIGQGIGSSLLSSVIATAPGNISLRTFARNSEARRFYERKGFVAVDFGFEVEWRLYCIKYLWVSTQ